MPRIPKSPFRPVLPGLCSSTRRPWLASTRGAGWSEKTSAISHLRARLVTTCGTFSSRKLCASTGSSGVCPTTCGFCVPVDFPLAGSMSRCPSHASSDLSPGVVRACWMVPKRSARPARFAGVSTDAFPRNGSTCAFPIHASPEVSPGLRFCCMVIISKRSVRPRVTGAGGAARPSRGSYATLPNQVSAFSGASGREYCSVSKSATRPVGLVGPDSGGRFEPWPGPAPGTARNPVCASTRASSAVCASSRAGSWNLCRIASGPYCELPAPPSVVPHPCLQ
mmetsp:Transcript_21860/g.54046  ORF Transcript_21860/g.54046 Transcript_21860/m.54046 type:complete len:280 (-) Transcript_21860:466-1305(-)